MLLLDTSASISGKIMVKVKIKGTTIACYVNNCMEQNSTSFLTKRSSFLEEVFWRNIASITTWYSTKRLKIGKEIEEAEVVALFGPCSCNNYKYYHNEDESLISKVETLWMIYIKKPRGPTLKFD